jgi:hypothetical protein
MTVRATTGLIAGAAVVLGWAGLCVIGQWIVGAL